MGPNGVENAGPAVLMATAEYAPLIKAGGLGEAVAGLVRGLRSQGAAVEVVIPDYGFGSGFGQGPVILSSEPEVDLELAEWAGRVTARRCLIAAVDGWVTLVRVPGIERPHPYLDPVSGVAWPDNDRRFFAFSAAVAALAAWWQPDIVHCNDWHTALVPGLLAGLDEASRPSVVFAIHNLAYQGEADVGWIDVLPGNAAAAYRHDGLCNPVAGALQLADRLVAVSPSYADEITRPAFGSGLDTVLSARGRSLNGIRNGLDTEVWDPAQDDLLPAHFRSGELDGKDLCRKALLARTTLEEEPGPVIGLMSRFVDQKGIDMALELAPYLANLPARLVLLGEGEANLVARAARLAGEHAGRAFYFARFTDELHHLLVAGCDLLLMPSRFEPCGLTQMQAMAYGTIPVVTPVGGLRDTVLDDDTNPGAGTGFVADQTCVTGVLDALHRAVRAWRDEPRRRSIQRRGMETDWSWSEPAARYVDLYRNLLPAAAACDLPRSGYDDGPLSRFAPGAHAEARSHSS